MSLKDSMRQLGRVLGEARDTLTEHFEAARMLDPEGPGKALRVWPLLLGMFFLIGLGMLRFGLEPGSCMVVFYFLGLCFLFLQLGLYSTVRERRLVIELMTQGTPAMATVVKRGSFQADDDVIPYYYYVCEFTARFKGGGTKRAKARIGGKVEDIYAGAEAIPVRYLARDPMPCAEEPDPDRLESLVFRKPETIFLFLVLACSIIAVLAPSEAWAAGVHELRNGLSRDAGWMRFLKGYVSNILSHPPGRRHLELLLPGAALFTLAQAVLLFVAHPALVPRRDTSGGPN